jgi:hypothetical protein
MGKRLCTSSRAAPKRVEFNSVVFFLPRPWSSWASRLRAGRRVRTACAIGVGSLAFAHIREADHQLVIHCGRKGDQSGHLKPDRADRNWGIPTCTYSLSPAHISQ